MKQPDKLWYPTWPEVEGAAMNLGRRNLWRVRPLYDIEDLMGEAYIVFLRIVRKYPRVIDPPHFMSLFLSSWSRVLHSMASRRTKSASGHVVPVPRSRGADGEELDPLDLAATTIPSWQQDEIFRARVAEAPAPVQALIEGLDRPGRPRRCARRANGTRETTNAYLCRIAKVDPEATDLRGELNRFLESGSV